jgi:hypothetical protein
MPDAAWACLIALTTPRLSPSVMMKVGVEHGIGCYPDKLPEDERTKTAVPDQFRHEIAAAFNLKGRGLVVLIRKSGGFCRL